LGDPSPAEAGSPSHSRNLIKKMCIKIRVQPGVIFGVSEKMCSAIRELGTSLPDGSRKLSGGVNEEQNRSSTKSKSMSAYA